MVSLSQKHIAPPFGRPQKAVTGGFSPLIHNHEMRSSPRANYCNGLSIMAGAMVVY